MSTQVKRITKKTEDISGWYNDVIREARLAEHGPVRGTMIIRPYGFAIWEAIQKNLNIKIKDLGAQNAYFPLFIPYGFLQKEKAHVEGFSPELAVVTHGGGEKLTEPVVVRPTSETIMYDAFARWISTFRDLPLVINQWNNVVRWEKRPYMFLRTTEFLWQEGHSAHKSVKEAQQMVDNVLKMYVDFYQNTLAIYGYAGKKSESEKFAGADKTFTYEILAPDGRVIQGCTSHNLGQNFSKAFKVQFQDEQGKTESVFQTSWGLTTRSIGALILSHGDDNGLVLPPSIAPVQVVIIPIASKSADKESIQKLAGSVFELLEGNNIRVKLDDSPQSVGWKFNEYDLQGIPLRLEIGASELRSRELRVVRRDNKDAFSIKFETLGFEIEQLLGLMQKDLLEHSKGFTLENTRFAENYEQFKKIMQESKGFIEAFWCEEPSCEQKIKEETKASTRCLPLDGVEGRGSCVYCEKNATNRWLFAQSY